MFAGFWQTQKNAFNSFDFANSGQKNVEFSQQKTSATHLNIHVFFQKLSYSLKINICLCVVSFESCYDFEQLLKEKEH